MNPDAGIEELHRVPPLMVTLLEMEMLVLTKINVLTYAFSQGDEEASRGENTIMNDNIAYDENLDVGRS